LATPRLRTAAEGLATGQIDSAILPSRTDMGGNPVAGVAARAAPERGDLAAFGYQLPERCFIGLDAGGQPQGDRGEVLNYVRRVVIERPPDASAICGQ
jgi:hypothetical protein